MTSASEIHSLCHELTERRKHLLSPRPTDELVHVLGQLSRCWLNPAFPWRQRAIEGMPKVVGFSSPMVERIIDMLFAELTEDKLGDHVESELGKLKDKETGPPLIAQIFSGNIPNSSVVSLVCGLLVKSANFCKASSRDPLFSTLYLASLHEIDPDLASCVQIQRWKGGDAALESALFEEANLVLAYGDDSSLHAVKSLLPPGKRFLGFGHKIGFAIACREMMTTASLPATAMNAAEDITLYDQQGCLSPHVVYVEEGGECSPRQFAETLAVEMERFNVRIPRGKISLEESAAIARVRDACEFRASSDPRVAVWRSKQSDSWTVIYEDEPMFATSPLNRVVFVKPLRELESSLAFVQPYIHNVGVACEENRRAEWEAVLKDLGVARVCPLGQMQKPSLSFATGIRPRLRELISLNVI